MRVFSKSKSLLKAAVVFAILFYCYTPKSNAETFPDSPAAPLSVRTQNPIYLQFLALPLERPQTLSKGQFAANVSTSFSNVFEYLPGGSETVDLDLEQWRTAFQFDFGIAKNLDARVEIPLISQFGGFLDGFLENYHELFGLPNAGREKKKQGGFGFKVTKGSQTLLNFNRQALGFSDASIRVKYKLLTENQNAPISVATAFFLKLPTGETTNGLGSGFADLGFAVSLEKNLRRWRFNSALGSVFLGGHDTMNENTRWGFVQFGQSVSFATSQNFALTAELSGNTSALKNFQTDLLADPALELTLGINGKLPFGDQSGQSWFYNAGFSEDILSRGPSVDFSLFAQVGVKY